MRETVRRHSVGIGPSALLYGAQPSHLPDAARPRAAAPRPPRAGVTCPIGRSPRDFGAGGGSSSGGAGPVCLLVCGSVLAKSGDSIQVSGSCGHLQHSSNNVTCCDALLGGLSQDHDAAPQTGTRSARKSGACLRNFSVVYKVWRIWLFLQ